MAAVVLDKESGREMLKPLGMASCRYTFTIFGFKYCAYSRNSSLLSKYAMGVYVAHASFGLW